MTTPTDQSAHDALPGLDRALDDLAHEAPVGAHDPTLFSRSMRAHRTRRAWTSAALVVLVIGLASVTGLAALTRAPSSIQPAGSSTPAGLPSVVQRVSPYLAGTNGEPWQPVAVLVEAPRATGVGALIGRTGTGLLAVSTSGEYRFLDLPEDWTGADSGGLLDLSPDGRRVAFWVTGETSGAPYHADQSTVGVAVLDLTTGAVTRQAVDTEHGLDPGEVRWADDDRVVWSYTQIAGGPETADDLVQVSGDSSGTLVWDVDAGTVDRISDQVPVAVGTERVVVQGRGRWGTCIDLTSGSQQPVRTADGGFWLGNSEAVVLGEDCAQGWNYTSMLPGRFQVTRADGSVTTHPGAPRLVWPLTLTASTATWWGPRLGDQAATIGRLWSVDLATDEASEILRVPGRRGLVGVATDLVDLPTIEAQDPGRPAPLPWFTAAGAAVLLLGLGLLLRGRARARAAAAGGTGA
ncbi:hypothetical protein [Nocardioides bruguierae]|uniref:hypothetical protein n=1 Tax=Nocardioides bruguierae TaxID=2945102 RepID=UPI002021D4E6|nr:hypothetical protein [Nocardioides bruguierae]MCL8024360.1 hypothetical protein [Nocardioides bruguierae]